jgi:predicted GTPase
MHKASIALAAGAAFVLLGPRQTMLTSRLPVIALCTVRTGVGRSQTARWVIEGWERAANGRPPVGDRRGRDGA